MKKRDYVWLLFFVVLFAAQRAIAQPMPHQTPDVTNKALITTATPDLSKPLQGDAAALHKLANDYYDWRNQQYPVGSSDAGLHTW
ncbi:MAG TPA: hypothetical protein VHW03_07545, partial [Chthoniobacterales bacterium]|nr:hypothetical protein [Chthoniobacterales bacterium]